jgi:hypothetical protein
MEIRKPRAFALKAATPPSTFSTGKAPACLPCARGAARHEVHAARARDVDRSSEARWLIVDLAHLGKTRNELP